MSIVLDALEKVERERVRPQEAVVLAEATPAPRRRLKPSWVVLISLLVVVNVALLGGLLWFNYPLTDNINVRLGEAQKLRAQLVNRPMTSHVWSKRPASRFILIEGVLIREGESLGEDILLTKITETGIRVSYKGRTYPFSIGELWPDLADVF